MMGLPQHFDAAPSCYSILRKFDDAFEIGKGKSDDAGDPRRAELIPVFTWLRKTKDI
jgi:hypothetical protein